MKTLATLLISVEDYRVETCIYLELYKRTRKHVKLREVPPRRGTPSYTVVKYAIYQYAYTEDYPRLLYSLLLANKHYGVLDVSLC